MEWNAPRPTVERAAETLGLDIDAATAEALAEQFGAQNDLLSEREGLWLVDEPPDREYWRPQRRWRPNQSRVRMAASRRVSASRKPCPSPS